VIHFSVDRPGPLGTRSFVENPLSDELIRCKSNQDVYTCSYGGVAMSDGDEMDITSRVPVAKSTLEPVAASYLVWH
jgi:hypothetical protein